MGITPRRGNIVQSENKSVFTFNLFGNSML